MKINKITYIIIAVCLITASSSVFLYNYFSKEKSSKSVFLHNYFSKEKSSKVEVIINNNIKPNIEYLTSQQITKIQDCEKNANYKMCISRLVVKKEDCSLLASTTIKNFCEENFNAVAIVDSGKAQNCKTLPERTRAGCLDTIFTSYKNIEQCNEGLTSEEKQRCLDLFNYNSSIASLNNSDCEKIVDKILNKNCKETIANMPQDQDSDGLNDSFELSIGTDAFKSDTDYDGLSDGDEIKIYKTSPKIKDTDGDNLSDKNETVLGTNQLVADTDKDGFKDGDEYAKGFNPCGDGQLPEVSVLKSNCQALLTK